MGKLTDIVDNMFEYAHWVYLSAGTLVLAAATIHLYNVDQDIRNNIEQRSVIQKDVKDFKKESVIPYSMNNSRDDDNVTNTIINGYYINQFNNPNTFQP